MDAYVDTISAAVPEGEPLAASVRLITERRRERERILGQRAYTPPAERRRIVSVRYRVTAYVDVDLDRGEIVAVFLDDESPRPDEHRDASDLVEPAYAADGRPYAVDITPELAARALAIAEDDTWPEWGR